MLTLFSFWHIIIVTEPRTPLFNAYHAGSFNFRTKEKWQNNINRP